MYVLLETTTHPVFAGRRAEQRPAIVGPEKYPDIDPEYPGKMPKVRLPWLEKPLAATAFRQEPDLTLEPRAELALPEVDMPNPTAWPNMILPLPPDVLIRDGEEVHVTFPERDETEALHYRLDFEA